MKDELIDRDEENTLGNEIEQQIHEDIKTEIELDDFDENIAEY